MNTSGNHRKVSRLALSGLLTAVMLVLGYLESQLPSVGIPGIKPGLSNSVLIFAVYMLGARTAYIMMTLKVVLSGLLFGGVTAMAYAFAGGLASLTVMCLLSRFPKLPAIAVSMAGAVVHNAAQVGVAMLILHTPVQMLYYLAVLVLAGLGCGLLTGIIAASVMKYVKTASFGIRPAERVRRPLATAAVAAVLAAAAVLLWLLLKKQTPVELLPDPDQALQLLSPEELTDLLSR